MLVKDLGVVIFASNSDVFVGFNIYEQFGCMVYHCWKPTASLTYHPE